MKTVLKILFTIALIVVAGYFAATKFNLNPNLRVGQKIDSLHGVIVYYNGGVGNNEGRNISEYGYNIGIKYQCVEFVKRYYYQVYHHKMPEDRGNAKDFFDLNLKPVDYNTKRGLNQIKNGYGNPEVGDLVVFAPNIFNRYGHVAIISKVDDKEVEIIQQNAGPFAKSREIFPIIKTKQGYEIQNNRIYGWLHKVIHRLNARNPNWMEE